MPDGVQDPELVIGKVSAFLADPQHCDASARFCIGAVRTFIDDPEHKAESAHFCLALAKLLAPGVSNEATGVDLIQSGVFAADVPKQDPPAPIRGPPVNGMVRYQRRASNDDGGLEASNNKEEERGSDREVSFFEAVSNEPTAAFLSVSAQKAKNARDDRMTILGTSNTKRKEPKRKGPVKVEPVLEGPVLMNKDVRANVFQMDLDHGTEESGVVRLTRQSLGMIDWLRNYRR
jgi:hypothetical protein